MSRSSLVWGDFSVVWGLAVTLATVLLYGKGEGNRIFWIGTCLGGIYEYLCSVFTELFFGKVFWDYSNMPFQLGGRINLLYCFLWGLAAVVWIKFLYPKLSILIHYIMRITGRMLTIVLAIFMVFNICISMMALIRYDKRSRGNEAVRGWEQIMDYHFDDARMERIYPNAIAR